jgi:cytoskeletal protein CcmA (bactofilin family)
MFNKENTPVNNISSNSSSKLDTILGKNTSITGDVKFSGVLVLDGNVTGSLIGSNKDGVLTINESGRVEGKIEVANIIINGTVKGDIIASGKIEVASKASIEGNIYYQNIEMEAGSKINGQLIYQEGEKVSKISNIENKKAK